MITYNNSVLKVGSSWLEYTPPTPPVYRYSVFIDINNPSAAQQTNIAICSLKIDGQSATSAQNPLSSYKEDPSSSIYRSLTSAEQTQIRSTSNYLYKTCSGIWIHIASGLVDFSTISFKTTPSTATVTGIELVASLYKGTNIVAKETLVDQYVYTQRGNTTITLNRLA